MKDSSYSHRRLEREVFKMVIFLHRSQTKLACLHIAREVYYVNNNKLAGTIMLRSTAERLDFVTSLSLKSTSVRRHFTDLFGSVRLKSASPGNAFEGDDVIMIAVTLLVWRMIG